MANDIFRRIKDTLPVWEVAARYGKISVRPGAGRMMPCVFHTEKTASLLLAEDHYHCFGCGVHGDVFDLVEHMEKLDKAEAVEFLAHLAGISPEEMKTFRGRREDVGVREEREQILEILAIAEDFFRKALLDPQAPGAALARGELASRQLPSTLVERIGFGYAPDTWSALAEHLLGLGYKLDLLTKTGVVTRGSSGRPIDFMRHRLVIPIRNKAGRVISFAGRHLANSSIPAKRDEQGEEIEPPKYVNGPETSVFSKGAQLFALDQAISMRNQPTWALVEGYFDATALLGASIPAVAPMGTALTEAQAKEISRCAQKVIVWLDPDSGGQKATRKAIPLLLAQGLRVEVVRCLDLGEGTKWDPDMVVRAQGPSAAKDMLLAVGSRALEDWTAWLIPYLCVVDGLSRTRKQDRLELLRRVATVLVEGFREQDPPRAQLDLLAMELEVPVTSVLGALSAERKNRSQDRLREQQNHAMKNNVATPLPPLDPVIWLALEALADGDVRGMAMVRQVDPISWEMLPNGHLILEILDANGVPESPLAVAAMAEATARRRQKAVTGDLQLLHVLVKRRVLSIRLEELDQALNSAVCLAPTDRERLVKERLKVRCELQSMTGGHLRKTVQEGR